MRPRVFPAEDVVPLRQLREPFQASMRPRVFPAEDSAAASGRPRCGSRFNEAAGIPRGRPRRFRRSGRRMPALQ